MTAAPRPPLRVPWDLEESPFARAVARAKAERADLVDLTGADPTRAGLVPDPEALRAALLEGDLTAYRPEAAGRPEARAAVAAYYRDHGVEVSLDRVLLTASTSEAYAFLFKVLCDPGEAVAVPRPSYPLFEFLTAVEAVRPVPYRLVREERWRLDLESVREALTEGARAVLVVHPSNPVGAVMDAEERQALVRLCAEAGAALVVDEVFLDYAPGARTCAGESGCTTFVLSGLSKVCALPQLKLGWIAASGPDAAVHLGRLELVADTFLSVNGPVQQALPRLLAERHPVQARIRQRVAGNRARLAAARPADAPWDVVAGDAGWYAVLRVPAIREDEAWAEAALEAGVVVHPGHLYDLPGAHLVMSLLTEPAAFTEGLARLLPLIAAA